MALFGPGGVAVITIIGLTVIAARRQWAASQALLQVFMVYMVVSFFGDEIVGAIQWAVWGLTVIAEALL